MILEGVWRVKWRTDTRKFVNLQGTIKDLGNKIHLHAFPGQKYKITTSRGKGLREMRLQNTVVTSGYFTIDKKSIISMTRVPAPG